MCHRRFPLTVFCLLIEVSIIAVHGLNYKGKDNQEHADGTWTAKYGKAKHSWLEADLPLKVPDARIFKYVYDARAAFTGGTDTFNDKANDLLENIRIWRAKGDTRPILLLGHSLGGQLIKQALINANNNPTYKPIKNAVSGLAFFATPHQGVESAPLAFGKLAAAMARSLGAQKGDNVLEALERDSTYLDLMADHWRHQVRDYDIVSFFGTQDTVSNHC